MTHSWDEEGLNQLRREIRKIIFETRIRYGNYHTNIKSLTLVQRAIIDHEVNSLILRRGGNTA
jgi:hypothetical protein